MSIEALSNYTFTSRYARYRKDKKRRETWKEAVNALFDMHCQQYGEAILASPELKEEIDFARGQQLKKRVLAAQRTLQFKGDPIFKHHLKVYNCLTTHINRERVFQEMMYALLCGCGVGFSVQKHHINQLGRINNLVDQNVEFLYEKDKYTQEEILVDSKPTNPKLVVKHTVKDSIEGWADAIGALMSSYFGSPEPEFTDYQGKYVEFDFSKIRPEGALIAGQFKAPGPNGLKSSILKIRKVIEDRLQNPNYKYDEFKTKLRPIDAYDIIMHTSDAVLSGGVRRSATLSLFSHNDEDMLTAKTGNWFKENPQRGRSNNSAALLKGAVSEAEFHKCMEAAEQCGEPGFIWVDNLEVVYNPCVEIGMIPTTIDGKPGWQGCNL
jgi:ribonucleoside-diphosphate reductase alpha chain